MKIIHKKILRENSKKILTKDFVITHHVKNVSQNDDNVIKKCHKIKVNRHLEVRKTENFI